MSPVYVCPLTSDQVLENLLNLNQQIHGNVVKAEYNTAIYWGEELRARVPSAGGLLLLARPLQTYGAMGTSHKQH